MRDKIITIVVALSVVGACGVFASTFVHAYLISPEKETTVEKPSAAFSFVSADPGVPKRLIIPALNINASVQDVGLGKTGNMAVPSNYSDVGWYRYGSKPGERGSAVIDGHVDNGFSLPAVFKQLGKLVPGDDIYIETMSGVHLHFVVEHVETYAASDVPKDLLFNRADDKRLNLITCAGDWLPEQKAYDERTVVYTRLVS